jgi:AcrR family transcriptional regulator
MSNSSEKRRYRLGRRAEKKEETRLRIVEATIELHGSVGPANTSIAQIATRAGVQRHTIYAHFPDERSLMMACSGLSLDRDPLPDPEKWKSMPAGQKRLSRGLSEIYGWYERNAELAACVLRDAEHHLPTREIVGLRMTPIFSRAAEVLGEGLDERAGVLLAVALDFACWRTLKDAGRSDAADIMATAIDCMTSRSQRS